MITRAAVSQRVPASSTEILSLIVTVTKSENNLKKNVKKTIDPFTEHIWWTIMHEYSERGECMFQKILTKIK